MKNPDSKKEQKYERLYKQLKELFDKTNNPIARMATIAAVLHHKMDDFFWTGFYIYDKGNLVVGPYQGPLACMLLKKNTGVCWAGYNTAETVVVPDVHVFPGHIACSSLSNSEIVVPFFNKQNKVVGVLDIDSRKYDNFNETDAKGLEKIVSLIYA